MLIEELRESVNREHLLQWIEALESGDYKQGQERLAQAQKNSQDLSFCCLGVGCEVAKIKRSFIVNEFLYGCRSKDVPPIQFYEWLGIYNKTNQLDLEAHLVAMNDSGGKSFVFIARFLRKVFGV